MKFRTKLKRHERNLQKARTRVSGIQLFSFCLTALVALVGFQNCSRTSFSSSEMAAGSTNPVQNEAPVDPTSPSAPVAPVLKLAPVVQCGFQTYQVGETVSCWIANADAETLCSQEGTFSAAEQKCTNYGWTFDQNAELLRYSGLVQSAWIGQFLIKARNSAGSSVFTLNYVAVPSNPGPTVDLSGRACVPEPFFSSQNGMITPIGVIGFTDSQGKCTQSLRCDSDNGYIYPADSSYFSHHSSYFCFKYKIDTNPQQKYTWGGASGLSSCEGWGSSQPQANTLDLTWSASSNNFMNETRGNGEFPLILKQKGNVANTAEWVNDSSKSATCQAYYYFTAERPVNPHLSFNPNVNSGNNQNTYSGDICNQMNNQIRAAFPSDTKTNRCSKAYDFLNTQTPTGVPWWMITCVCDSM